MYSMNFRRNIKVFDIKSLFRHTLPVIKTYFIGHIFEETYTFILYSTTNIRIQTIIKKSRRH